MCTPPGARERRLANWTLAVFLWPLTCAVCLPSFTTYVLEVRQPLRSRARNSSGADGDWHAAAAVAAAIHSALDTAQFFQYAQLLAIFALLASLISLLNRWSSSALRTRLEAAIAAATMASASARVASRTAAAAESEPEGAQFEQRSGNGAPSNGGASGGTAGRPEALAASSVSAQSEARQSAELEVRSSFERQSAADRWEALRVHRLICLLYLFCWSLNPLSMQL